MNISLSSSANTLINNAQHKAADAAQKIATLPMQKDEIGSSEYNAADAIKPILSLKEAEFETAAAAKLLIADKEKLGSILDVRT